MASGLQSSLQSRRIRDASPALGAFVAVLIADVLLHSWFGLGEGSARERIVRAALAALPVAGLASWLVWRLGAASRDARARLDSLCQATQSGWVELDRQGRISSASDLASAWLSGAGIPFLGHSLAEIFPLSEGGAATWLGDEHLAPRPGPFAACPARLRALTRGAGGRILAILRLPATRRDEPGLRDAERRFRVLWDHSRDGLRLIDASGTILDVNEAYCNQVGKPREELVGQPSSTVCAEPRHAHILSTFQQHAEGRIVEPLLERREILWDDREVYWEITNAFLVADGGTAPYILSIFRDATRRKVNEERVRHLEAALDLVPDAVAFVEGECGRGGSNGEGGGGLGRISYANAAFGRLVGADAPALAGRPLGVIAEAGAGEEPLTRAREALGGEESASLEWEGSRKDGTPFLARLDLVPALDRLRKETIWIALQHSEPALPTTDHQRGDA